MRPCHRPLDPIDAEAVAAGADPVFSADAAGHARECPFCGALVAAAASFSGALDGLSEASEAVSDMTDRLVRLRAFSRRERRTYALWALPTLLSAGLAAVGLGLLAIPVLTAGDQISLGAAALVPLSALVRSASRSAFDLLALAPGSLAALSDGLRRESAMGLAALALLVPLVLGLRRALARARVSGRR